MWIDADMISSSRFYAAGLTRRTEPMLKLADLLFVSKENAVSETEVLNKIQKLYKTVQNLHNSTTLQIAGSIFSLSRIPWSK